MLKKSLLRYLIWRNLLISSISLKSWMRLNSNKIWIKAVLMSMITNNFRSNSKSSNKNYRTLRNSPMLWRQRQLLLKDSTNKNQRKIISNKIDIKQRFSKVIALLLKQIKERKNSNNFRILFCSKLYNRRPTVINNAPPKDTKTIVIQRLSMEIQHPRHQSCLFRHMIINKKARFNTN